MKSSRFVDWNGTKGGVILLLSLSRGERRGECERDLMHYMKMRFNFKPYILTIHDI